MARLWSCGNELNSTTAGVEWTTVGDTPTITSAIVHSGSYSANFTGFTSGTQMRLGFNHTAADENGPFYFRAYIYISTLPSSTNSIFVLKNVAGGAPVRMTLDNSGYISLYDTGLIGTTMEGLSLNKWYMLEIGVDLTGGSGSHIIQGRVNTNIFASKTNGSLSTGVRGIQVGANLNSETQTTGNWYFDDIAINDSTGTYQNSWPGPGYIIHLRPNAAGDISDWLNDYSYVDEITPDDGTTLVSTSTLNAEDLYNIDDPTNLGVNDIISCVMVGVRYRTSTAATAPTFKLEIQEKASGTKLQGSALTSPGSTWITNGDAVPRNYSLVSYVNTGNINRPWTTSALTTCQIGYIETVDQTTTVQISTVWLLVEYIPRIEKINNYMAPSSVSDGIISISEKIR